MASFQMLLDDVEEANDINAEQEADLKKFEQFLGKYSHHHHLKESVLYRKSIECAKTIEDAHLVESINKEHDEGDELAAALQKVVNGLVSPTFNSEYTVDDMVAAAKAYLLEECHHLDEEDQLIYPTISKQLSEKELEEVSMVFDAMDKPKQQNIAMMELASDQLISKYK
eukprot:CAMPEP_0202695566 /NCGR_PEP_ID=MMETSP1385-20130828/9135_1 /ASSEMBLY_ACC=CAM_ASM_000861 /TAXON_ID=933848 /ORGANISM="Elphidium margaritaceum" /LENGTH=169 /DNA_ID=CAMNT_0049351621 /DNA_START=184 /DNA_END=693 /DNA_ORIENTATION=-